MKALFAEDLGVKADGITDNTTALNSAISNAANDGVGLILPCGKVCYDGIVGLPAGFIGDFGMIGFKKRVTQLIGMSSQAALLFDLSASSNPSSNSIHLSDFSILAGTAAACETALTITYGNNNIPSSEYYCGSSIENIEVNYTPNSAGWTNGFDFWNCWHLIVDKCNLIGSPTNWAANAGAGCGTAIRHRSGANFSLRGITCEFWNTAWQAIAFNSAIANQGQDCQGISMTDIKIIECINGINYTGWQNGYGADLKIINFMIDNGNIQEAGFTSLALNYLNELEILGGSIYQSNGYDPVQIGNCNNGSFSKVSITAPVNWGVILQNGTNNITIDDVSFIGQSTGGGCLMQPQTAGNIVTKTCRALNGTSTLALDQSGGKNTIQS